MKTPNSFKPISLDAIHLPFAHHPHCDRYRHHLIWIANRPFCLGCFCMWSGIVSSALIGTTLNVAPMAIWSHLLIASLLLIPTAMQPWYQQKPFKILSRFSLGVCITWWIAGVFSVSYPLNWFLKIAVLAAVPILLAKVLLNLRQRYPDNPCSNCPEGHFPVCNWNIERLNKLAPEHFQLNTPINENVILVDLTTSKTKE